MGGPISADWHCLQIDAMTDTVVPFCGTAETVAYNGLLRITALLLIKS